jgi:hypothetical protein
MARVEGLTIKGTAEMDDDVKALVSGWKQRALDAEAENMKLRKENKKLKARVRGYFVYGDND